MQYLASIKMRLKPEILYGSVKVKGNILAFQLAVGIFTTPRDRRK
jgi:hypothetical protein